MYFISYFKNLFENFLKVKYFISVVNTINDETDNLNEDKLENIKTNIYNNGSLYIKFFQWYISNLKSKKTSERNNVVINYFSDIFDQCPVHNLEHTLNIYRKDYDNDLYDYIEEDSLEILASGSIGQVYKAKLKNTDQYVAIKVKHPNIDTDIENQKSFVEWLKYFQSYRYIRVKYKLFFNIDDFLDNINLQLDFNIEAQNTLKFIDNFKDNNLIKFPLPIKYSKNILVSEYIECENVDEITNYNKYKVAINLYSFINQCMIIDNFMHGDLHCKNWSIRKQIYQGKEYYQIVIFDCGICFSNSRGIEGNLELWKVLDSQDHKLISNLVKNYIVDDVNNNIDEVIKKSEQIFISDCTSKITDKYFCFILDIILNSDIILDSFLINISTNLILVDDFLTKQQIWNKEMMSKETSTYSNSIKNQKINMITLADHYQSYPKLSNLLKEHLKSNIFNMEKPLTTQYANFKFKTPTD
tara:strand:- start:374 stop:1786 length:1413 start_codon:yes stop_codon:yes gene_type:complete